MTKLDRQKDKQTPYQHNIWIKISSFFSIRVNKLLWRMQIFTIFWGMRPVKDTLHLQRLFEFFWRRTQFKMHLKKAIWFFGFDEFSNALLIWLFQIGGWEEFSRKYPPLHTYDFETDLSHGCKQAQPNLPALKTNSNSVKSIETFCTLCRRLPRCSKPDAWNAF